MRMAIKRLMAKALPDYLVNQVTVEVRLATRRMFTARSIGLLNMTSDFLAIGFSFSTHLERQLTIFWRATSVIMAMNRIGHGGL